MIICNTDFLLMYGYLAKSFSIIIVLCFQISIYYAQSYASKIVNPGSTNYMDSNKFYILYRMMWELVELKAPYLLKAVITTYEMTQLDIIARHASSL